MSRPTRSRLTRCALTGFAAAGLAAGVATVAAPAASAEPAPSAPACELTTFSIGAVSTCHAAPGLHTQQLVASGVWLIGGPIDVPFTVYGPIVPWDQPSWAFHLPLVYKGDVITR